MPFGAALTEAGVRFRLWAPRQAAVQVALEGGATHAMTAKGDGWFEAVVPEAGPGTRYRFVLADGLAVPDPASRFQPEDVHGPSEVIDPTAFVWSDTEWRGRPWEEAVIYELHVGTFTQEGTFRAAIERLPALRALGITAIELMPLADFPGQRNWGYDGVLPFAPDSSYGRPEDLKALIAAAHEAGLMVLLDVVYNHFGPDGNYLAAYAPIFNEKHHTPWGASVNYDAEGAATVRAFAIENALYWLEEYHFDGLRLDAVHAIVDDSPKHLLTELAGRVRDAFPDRHVHLVLENEANEASRLTREGGRPIQYTAQWNDDVHHVLHVAASGETFGYYGDYAGDTDKLGRALAEGFAFQGETMPYRGGPRGEASGGLPPTAFVAFIQNHDQIGNRAFGERLHAIAPAQAVRAAAAIYLLLPQIPMLFMGEEWGASTPFPFFCDFQADLAEAVRQGRRDEFKRFPAFRDPEARAQIPDPTAATTFAAAKLRWQEAEGGAHAAWREFYRAILAVRHGAIVPRLVGMGGNSGRYEVVGAKAVKVRWWLADGAKLTLCANLKAQPQAGFGAPEGELFWREGEVDGGRLGPWAVGWYIAAEPDA